MPLTTPWPDPTGGTIQSPFIYCSGLNIDFAGFVARITLAVHRDRASAFGGKSCVETLALDLGPSALVAAVDADGNATLTIPSLPSVLAANPALVAAIQSVVEALAVANIPGLSAATEYTDA